MDVQEITEGSAVIKTAEKVFYNPVQEFNRDISISVLNAFIKDYVPSTSYRKNKQLPPATAVGDDYTFTILEGLAATGLRSIRYAKEIDGKKHITANDMSLHAVVTMKQNVKKNEVDDLVTVTINNAITILYEHRHDQFDAVDLDPYGCPSIYLDAAVQAVKDGGLLLITATDMAVLAGNCPETCYSKYGAVSLRIKSCHEMALRILLQCIESHANRYGRYIEPMLSISADFYIRVFVKVRTGPNACKSTTSKLSMVYHCTGCDSFEFQPLGIIKTGMNNKPKFALPIVPKVGNKCEHCNQSYHMGGPIWTGPLHSIPFVETILQNGNEKLNTWKRIQGVLSVIREEIVNAPLYYVLERLSGTLHCETPPMLKIRSALLNAGYEVSYMHAHKTSIKTTASGLVMWDIMRTWIAQHPINPKKIIPNTPAANIIAKKPEADYSFDAHPDSNPSSRKQGFVRFQQNPQPHWGPGTRATVMVGDQTISKSKKNQGKRKRQASEESTKDVEAEGVV